VNVIGALWAAGDEACHKMTADFYTTLDKTDDVAVSYHHAVLELMKEKPFQPLYWTLGLGTRRLVDRDSALEVSRDSMLVGSRQSRKSRDFGANHILTEIIYEGCHTVLTAIALSQRLSRCLNTDICTTQPMKSFHKKSRDVSSRIQAYWTPFIHFGA